MKLTVIGAGVRTPFLLRGLVEREADLGLDEVVLYDVDAERLETMVALGRHLCDAWGSALSLRADHDVRHAVTGSRFVLSAFRVGQERARALDEAIALRHGVLGQETTGPAGFAMALRTIPVAIDLGRIVAQVEPEALWINFTNPVGIVTQALRDHTPIDAIGVCDTPAEMHRSLAQVLHVAPDELQVEYAGLNHAGWIRRALAHGGDRLPELVDRYEELRRADGSWQLFDSGLVRAIGLLPNEYLWFFYERERALERIRTAGETRGQQVEALNAALWPVLRERIRAADPDGAARAWERAMRTRHETYFARAPGGEDEPAQDEGGYEGLATDLMRSTVDGRSARLILDVPNDGAIPDLRDTDIVEVTCAVDAGRVRPLPQEPLPDHARALLEPLKAYERLTVEAAVRGSYPTAVQALLAHPLVGSFPLARAILDDLLEAHGGRLGAVRRG